MPTASQKPKGYGIGVEHQEADLAAGSGGACPEHSPRGRRGTPRPRPAVAEAARTAQRPGLILAATGAVGTLGGSTPLPWHDPPRLCGEPIAGTDRRGEPQGLRPGVNHREGEQSSRCTPPAQDAPPEAPRRAPPGSPLVKGYARRADWLVWRDRSGAAGAHRASADGLAP
jgi:hypothetical protein